MKPGVDLHRGLVLPRPTQQYLALAPGRERARFLATACGLVCESFAECHDLFEATPFHHGAIPWFGLAGAQLTFSSPIAAESVAVIS
ncbi:hypothetical protein JJB98_26125 [Bradyrhizobium diazoefficiens]|nr:hypothetical protein JJB98_26125 [Bradyrhizobium diazoefficiens]